MWHVPGLMSHDPRRLYESLSLEVLVRLAVVHVALCILKLLVHLGVEAALGLLLSNMKKAGGWRGVGAGRTSAGAEPPLAFSYEDTEGGTGLQERWYTASNAHSRIKVNTARCVLKHHVQLGVKAALGLLLLRRK